MMLHEKKLSMAKAKKNRAKLFEDLKEGLEAAIDLAKGKRVANTTVTSVTITPVRKRTPT
jgi:hypothetical protein